MHRCRSSFLATLAITCVFIVALTGCLGKSSGNSNGGGVSSVTLSPGGTLSMDVGGTQVFSAAARNAQGKPILGLNIQYIVTSGTPNAPAQFTVASNGYGCAGTWDASVSQCNPGTTGIAYVQAVTNGVFSAQTTIYIHQHVDNIQINQIQNPPPQYDCFYQGQTWDFEAIAYSGNPPVDISNSVGPVTWSSTNAGVVTTAPNLQNPTALNQIQTTAASPGITQIFASVSGTTSAAYPYTTCLVKAIYLQVASQGQQGNSIIVDNGASIPINATVIDTLYNIAPGDNFPLAKPPLTWSTTVPEVAGFSTTTNTTASNNATARNNLGGATLTASCTPPSCNIGVFPSLPIYASKGTLPNGTTGYGEILVDVTSTTAAPTYTAWAATTDCQNQQGCDSALFSVTPTIGSGKNPICPTCIVSLPRTPNSMVFDHQASAKLYIGTDQGLMYASVAGKTPGVSEVSISPTPCNVSLCGEVLTVSNDGKRVVVSDTVSTTPQVYIYNSTSGVAPIDLILSNPGEIATAAAFSPDQLKIFLLTNLGNMYIYSTVDPLTSIPIANTATSVAFAADGSFAYVGGTPTPGTAISAFATCNAQLPKGDLGSVATPGVPFQIFPSPDALHVLALDPANDSIDVFTTTDVQSPLLNGQAACNDPIVDFGTVTPLGLGQEKNFTPIYAQLVNDGANMIVLAQNVPAVLIVNVSNGTTSSIPITGSPATGCPQCSGSSFPLSASASTDGSQVFVAACDQYNGTTCTAGSVHIIGTCDQISCIAPPAVGFGDFQQVPYVNINENNNPNMCNGQGAGAPMCLPNMIAIAPQ
jgi:hypothetical protein